MYNGMDHARIIAIFKESKKSKYTILKIKKKNSQKIDFIKNSIFFWNYFENFDGNSQNNFKKIEFFIKLKIISKKIMNLCESELTTSKNKKLEQFSGSHVKAEFLFLEFFDIFGSTLDPTTMYMYLNTIILCYRRVFLESESYARSAESLDVLKHILQQAADSVSI